MKALFCSNRFLLHILSLIQIHNKNISRVESGKSPVELILFSPNNCTTNSSAFFPSSYDGIMLPKK